MNNQDSGDASFATQGLSLTISQNYGPQGFAAGIAHSQRFRQIRFPFTAAQATIVLPDSSRSGSAVGGKKGKTL